MLSKSTKICINYLLGIAISIVLLWAIYGQVSKQLASLDQKAWTQTGWNGYLAASLCLMLVNVALEAAKWFLLTRAAGKVSFSRALGSYLCGIAVSLVTPNRVGDYPARVLYLGGRNTFRYITVSILGLMSQLCAVFFFGLLGLIYYNSVFPSAAALTALVLCAGGCVALVVIYLRFDSLLPLLKKVKFMRRFAIYGRLLGRFPWQQQVRVLAISALRFSVFTAQYLFLLKWMNVNVPLIAGFWTAGLFFWAMAVLPSFAFSGVAMRTKVGLLLFGHFSMNVLGIAAATLGLWLLNLVIPAIAGSILIMNMRLAPRLNRSTWQTR